MFGEEKEDLREGFKGLPLARRMTGDEGVRERGEEGMVASGEGREGNGNEEIDGGGARRSSPTERPSEFVKHPAASVSVFLILTSLFVLFDSLSESED